MEQKEYKLKFYELHTMYHSKALNLEFECFSDLEVTRGDLWSNSQKTSYIDSIFKGYILNPMHIAYKKINEKELIKGKQRLITVIDFIDNKYKLSENISDVFGENLKGEYFKDLSKPIQNKILNYEISVIEIKGSKEELTEAYIKYNEGVPMKPIELFRVKLGQNSMLLNEVINHKIFKLINLNGTKRFQAYELALYLLMIENDPEAGMDKDVKEVFVERLASQEEFRLDLLNKVLLKLDYLYKVFNRPKYLDMEKSQKYLKKTHLTVIFIILEKAIKHDITELQFFNWCNDFFYEHKDSTNKYWIESSRGSTTSKSSLKIRVNELNKNFEETFKVQLSPKVVLLSSRRN